MSNPCDLPPCPPCPAPTPPPCPQICPPPPPTATCRGKPIMRGLHWTQTKKVLMQALAASALAGTLVYIFIGRAHKEAYRDFYAKAELDDWADEMARKGLFQSVPKQSLEDIKK